jgi:hypothetical protein
MPEGVREDDLSFINNKIILELKMSKSYGV